MHVFENSMWWVLYKNFWELNREAAEEQFYSCFNVKTFKSLRTLFSFPFGQTIEVVVRCGFSLEGYDWLLVYTVLIIMPPAVGVMILLPACDLNLTFKFWVVQVFSAVFLFIEFWVSVFCCKVCCRSLQRLLMRTIFACYLLYFLRKFIYNFDLVCNYLYLLEIL